MWAGQGPPYLGCHVCTCSADQRDQAGHSADHDEDLQGDRECQPGREELAEVILASESDADASADEEHVQTQDRENTDEPELFAEARDDAVALRQRRQLVMALAEPRADQPALRESEDALDELEASPRAIDHLGIEGVPPGRDAGSDICHDL